MNKRATKPLDVDTLVNHALQRYQAGKPEEAKRYCEQALSIDPANANVLHLKGMAAKAMRNLDEAEADLRQALAYAPEIPGKSALFGNLANILVEQGRTPEALDLFRTAIAINPADADARSNYGNTLRVLGRWQEAEQVLREACALAPRRADVLNNLAAVLQQQGRINDAAEIYRAVLELDPTFAVANYNLACLYTDAGRLADAVAHHEAALAAQPEYLDAMTLRLRLAQMMCDWPAVAKWGDRLRETAERKDSAIFPFAFLALPATPAELQQCARRWVREQYKPFIRQRIELASSVSASRAGDGRIRIGYLSSDFHNHATAYLMAEVFELHDRSRFEVIAYSAGPDDGKAMRQRLVRAFDRFIDIRGKSHAEAAQLIRDDGIDVLVDLKGYTKDTRSAILALRPAPIQVNYLGYPGTMGADFIDYILADEFVLPPDQAVFYDEQPAWLPDSYQANDRRRAIAETPSRAECGLPQDAIVFCCFNHTYKITAEMFDVWCRLLQAVPDSVLWLLKSNAWAEERLRQEAAQRGIDAARLVFGPERPLDQHLARLRNADLFLDTLPYNAHTTASDALWAGVPVVTCARAPFASRVAGSLLRAVGLPELVTTTLDDYFALARDLAQDQVRRMAIRGRLHDTRDTAPLFDAPRFTRHLERLYELMQQLRLAGQPPRPLRLSDNDKADIAVALEHGDAMNGHAMNTTTEQAATSTTIYRTPFPACPLCGGRECTTAGSFDCTMHSNWSAPLPGTLNWKRCTACQHVFTDSYYTDAGLAVLFGKAHENQLAGGNWDAQRSVWAPVIERVLRTLPEPERLYRDEALSWLDVGCGNGALVFTAAEFGFKATGLDMRDSAVRRIREMGYSAICGDLLNAQPTDKAIDVISMADLLEHVPYPLETLKQAHALLDERGALFISCPNMDTVTWTQMDRQKVNPYWVELEHYHNFTRRSLMHLLRQCGFEPVSYYVSPRYKACMEIIARKAPAGK